MASVFTKIINRELPAHIVAEDASFIAFLDIRPLTKGHTLVVPKEEIDDIFDQSEDTLAKLLPFARLVAKKIRHCVPCKRIGLSVVGLEVPHTHLHLIPINAVQDMNFARPPMQLSQDEMRSLAKAISEAPV